MSEFNKLSYFSVLDNNAPARDTERLLVDKAIGKNLSLNDWIDDLCVRFVLNLPHDELLSIERVCFQIEEAHWYYEDFVRPLNPSLPSMNIREFSLKFLKRCPLFASFGKLLHTVAFSEFTNYKTRVPVRGVVLLNSTMDQVVLVKGWKKNSRWSFPRGKINRNESDLDCAIREAYEETGFDLVGQGFVDRGQANKGYLELIIRDQHLRLYVFRGIPLDSHFEPKTRKEISDIRWFDIQSLIPSKELNSFAELILSHDGQCGGKKTKFYMVAPFIVPMLEWIMWQKKNDSLNQYRVIRTPDEGLGKRSSATYVDSAAVKQNLGAQIKRDTQGEKKNWDGRGESVATEMIDVAAELKRLLRIGTK